MITYEKIVAVSAEQVNRFGECCVALVVQARYLYHVAHHRGEMGAAFFGFRYISGAISQLFEPTPPIFCSPG